MKGLVHMGISATAVFLLSSCGMNRGTFDTYSAGPVTSTFSSIQQNILIPVCSRCHSFVGSYSGLMNQGWVVRGFPNSSKLYQAVASHSMPQGGYPLDSSQISAIYNWIQSGALQN